MENAENGSSALCGSIFAGSKTDGKQLSARRSRLKMLGEGNVLLIVDPIVSNLRQKSVGGREVGRRLCG
jgi:hypothetical protein